MFRCFDWECGHCGQAAESTDAYQQGRSIPRERHAYCGHCGFKTKQRRLPPLVGPYTGEQTRNPMVSGGKFDTMGYETVPRLPEIPEAAMGTVQDLKGFVQGKEYVEAKRIRREVVARNKAKRRRAELLKAGAPINMRRDKLPGDPTI